MSVLDIGDEFIPDLGDDEDGLDGINGLNELFDWNQSKLMNEF